MMRYSVAMEIAATRKLITRLTALPPRLAAGSVDDVVRVPELNWVAFVLGAVDNDTSASKRPAGTTMTNMALAIARKFRPQILNVASIRSPTPRGRNMRDRGIHVTSVVPASAFAGQHS